MAGQIATDHLRFDVRGTPGGERVDTSPCHRPRSVSGRGNPGSIAWWRLRPVTQALEGRQRAVQRCHLAQAAARIRIIFPQFVGRIARRHAHRLRQAHIAHAASRPRMPRELDRDRPASRRNAARVSTNRYRCGGIDIRDQRQQNRRFGAERRNHRNPPGKRTQALRRKNRQALGNMAQASSDEIR